MKAIEALELLYSKAYQHEPRATEQKELTQANIKIKQALQEYEKLKKQPTVPQDVEELFELFEPCFTAPNGDIVDGKLYKAYTKLRQAFSESEESDKSKEQSSIDYYNEMKECKSTLNRIREIVKGAINRAKDFGNQNHYEDVIQIKEVLDNE